MKVPMENPWLHRFCVLLAVCTLFLVVAGASVTSNEAGLSVPDWPLSYGKVMPDMTGGVFFEHGHRLIASTVGFLTVILAVWLWIVEDRRWMKWLGFAALLGVIAQGVLGGLTVLFLLPKPVSISHACLAQLFFSTTVAIAIFTSPSWRRGPTIIEDSGWPSLHSLALALPIATLLQVALGAGYRHKAFRVIPHVVGAIFVTVLLLMVSVFVITQAANNVQLRTIGWALLSVTCVQVILGVGSILARASMNEAGRPPLSLILLTVAHVATGALTMAGSVALTVLVFRNVRSHANLASHSQGLRTVS
jgi:heme a synthase